MPDNKTKKKDGSHLMNHLDLCRYEVALLMAAEPSPPLVVVKPKRLTKLMLDGLISRGLLARDPWPRGSTYVVSRTPNAENWLRDALSKLDRIEAANA